MLKLAIPQFKRLQAQCRPEKKCQLHDHIRRCIQQQIKGMGGQRVKQEDSHRKKEKMNQRETGDQVTEKRILTQALNAQKERKHFHQMMWRDYHHLPDTSQCPNLQNNNTSHQCSSSSSNNNNSNNKSIYLYLQLTKSQPLGRLYQSRYMPSRYSLQARQVRQHFLV